MQTGFTLIELLVVVLIIGILSAAALPQYETAVKKSRLSAYIPAVKTLADAEETYFLANGVYTGNISDLDVDMPAGFSVINAGDDGYVRAEDGTVLDLLGGSGKMAAGSGNAVVALTTRDGISYYHYLQYSSLPGGRRCIGDERVCKSMGGELISGTVYRLP